MRIVVMGLVAIGLVGGIAGAGSYNRGGKVSVLVDGTPLQTSPAPVIRGGRVFVPVLAFQKIGLAAHMIGGRTGRVGWPDSDRIIDFTAGVRTRVVGREVGKPRRIKLPGTPFMLRGKLMVPLRSFLSDRTDSHLTGAWDASTRTVKLRRSKYFMRLRTKIDYSGTPYAKWYSTPIMGDYVPEQNDK